MRKIVLSMFMSLDGVIETPAWSLPYWGDDIAQVKYDELFESDTLLLGRVTYEGFAEVWPERTDEQGWADRFNNMPKLVPTTTLDTPKWNARFVKANVIEEIQALKQQAGQHILIHGSARLVETLIPHNLIDEYRLLVYPLVLGTGQRLFNEGTKVNLRLVDSRTFSSGAVMLVYAPSGA